MTTSRVLKIDDANRLESEVGLRRQGYVPMTSYDALYPRFDELLPVCRVQELVTDADHGRLVWSHPGRSGLDPRAVAPLAIVRVADGLGPDPLDPPLDLATATRALLDSDVQSWLLRPVHRAFVRKRGGAGCLYELSPDARHCITHPIADGRLQEAADALGDVSYSKCRARGWSNRHCTQWGQPTDQPHDLAGLARCALEATVRLGGWLRRGVSGASAWDLTRLGISVEQLERWRAAGFATDEVPRWWEIGRPGQLARRREAGESPDRPVALPPAPTLSGQRGITAFVAWKMSSHAPDRYFALVRCSLCDAKDIESPCRTCVAERRTEPFETQWNQHATLATLGPAYNPGVAGNSVPCGDRNCRTSLALSATGVEEMQP